VAPTSATNVRSANRAYARRSLADVRAASSGGPLCAQPHAGVETAERYKESLLPVTLGADGRTAVLNVATPTSVFEP
jgi:hypothetical protein